LIHKKSEDDTSKEIHLILICFFLYFIELHNVDKEIVEKGSSYLVEKTFKSLQTMFMSAKEIQDWFTECSRVISIRCNQYVQWVTPLGLPVLQPYFKSVKSVDSEKRVNKM